MPRWSMEAPSNIALIKYMGKKDQGHPTNPSFSYTLKLRSFVEIEKKADTTERRADMKGGDDLWEAQWIPKPPWIAPELSERGKRRFLDHWLFLKSEFGIKGEFKIKSANNFPPDCGIASSASSFAALTLCAYEIAKSCGKKRDLSLEALAHLSAKGSGSSCRSFFNHWVEWSDKGEVYPLELPYQNLFHNVVLISSLKKSVSSSQAHLNIKTSLLNQGRAQRAKERLKHLKMALESRDWPSVFEVTWAEFWDMHALFETSDPSFGYMLGGSLEVLNRVRSFWRENKDGPLVTMDAGPNIHLLYREDQREIQSRLSQQLQGYPLL